MKRREFLHSAVAAGVSLPLGTLLVSGASVAQTMNAAGNSSALPSSEPAHRNATMIERIERSAVKYPYTFVFGGDCRATENPTGDGLFAQMLSQMEQLRPRPIFFANLGDFAGPGTLQRHRDYQRLIKPSTLPNIHVIGNHDVDDPSGWDHFHAIYGPENFSWAYGNTCFVAINCTCATNGLREEDLAFVDKALKDDRHEVRIVLMHMPPSLGGHYAPKKEWSFTHHEGEFLNILKKGKVGLVCCSHIIAYDNFVYEGIRFVTSGGLGWGLCSDYGYLAQDPPHRGVFYHFVEIQVTAAGAISGKVIRAFDGVNSFKPYEFGATSS